MNDNLNQGMRVKLTEQPWNECECGGAVFEPSLMFKRISPIISPTGKEEMVPVEMFTCKSCKKVPGFVLKMIPPIPDELKATKKLSLD